MSVDIIATLYDGTAHYQALVNLDGRDYRIQLDWNVRDEHWYFSLFLASGEPVYGAMFQKVVQNWPLARLMNTQDRPAGRFLVVSAQHGDPGLLDLGQGTLLSYISADSLAEVFP